MRQPVRTCVGCRTSRHQSELVRVVRQGSGGVWVDPGPRDHPRRPAGRGAYVCPDRACIDRALKTGALKRALRLDGPLPEALRAELMRRAGGEDEVNGEGYGKTEGA